MVMAPAGTGNVRFNPVTRQWEVGGRAVPFSQLASLGVTPQMIQQAMTSGAGDAVHPYATGDVPAGHLGPVIMNPGPNVGPNMDAIRAAQAAGQTFGNTPAPNSAALSQAGGVPTIGASTQPRQYGYGAAAGISQQQRADQAAAAPAPAALTPAQPQTPTRLPPGQEPVGLIWDPAQNRYVEPSTGIAPTSGSAGVIDMRGPGVTGESQQSLRLAGGGRVPRFVGGGMDSGLDLGGAPAMGDVGAGPPGGMPSDMSTNLMGSPPADIAPPGGAPAIVGEGGDAAAGGTGLELVIWQDPDSSAWHVGWVDGPTKADLQSGTVILPVGTLEPRLQKLIRESFPKLGGDALFKRGGVFIDDKGRKYASGGKVPSFKTGGGTDTPGAGGLFPNPFTQPNRYPNDTPTYNEAFTNAMNINPQGFAGLGGPPRFGNLAELNALDKATRDRLDQAFIAGGNLGGFQGYESELQGLAPGVLRGGQTYAA